MNEEEIYSDGTNQTTQLLKKQQLQRQANRLNSGNSYGSMAQAAGKMLGKEVSNDLANLITIRKTSKDAKLDSSEYYLSLEYKDRLRRAQVNPDNSERLTKRMLSTPTYAVNSKIMESDFPVGNSGSHRVRASTVPRSFVGRTSKKKYNPGVYYNTDTMRNGNGENVYGTFVHEYSHWGDQALTPDAKKFNHSLIQNNLNPNLNQRQRSYFGSDTEIRARAMDVLMNYKNNIDKYEDFNDFLEKEKDMKGLKELRMTFKDYDSMKNYLNRFVYNDESQKNEYSLTEEPTYYGKSGIKLYFKKFKLGGKLISRNFINKLNKYE